MRKRDYKKHQRVFAWRRLCEAAVETAVGRNMDHASFTTTCLMIRGSGVLTWGRNNQSHISGGGMPALLHFDPETVGTPFFLSVSLELWGVFYNEAVGSCFHLGALQGRPRECRRTFPDNRLTSSSEQSPGEKSIMVMLFCEPLRFS